MTDDQQDGQDEGAAIAELLRSLMGDPAALTEAEIRRRVVTAASLGRRVDAVKAALAAEAAARSRRQDGRTGWAAREVSSDGAARASSTCCRRQASTRSRAPGRCRAGPRELARTNATGDA